MEDKSLNSCVQFAVCSVGTRGKHLAVVLHILHTSSVLVRNLQNLQGLCMNLYVSRTILSKMQENLTSAIIFHRK